MPEQWLDFRSDTVTRPTPAMRQAMAAAEVGDDVYGEDPTVNRLQARVAELLGKEAALLVPSGTMSNLIAVRVHCRPGDELLCEAGCHIIQYEQGGYAQLNGVAAHVVAGHGGILRREQLEGLIRPDDPHMVRTRLVALENTHNRGGGTIQPLDEVQRIGGWARQAGLRTHLDGARLWNAAVATGIEARRWAEEFDTVSVCFSKGLGAPVGSALCGPRDLIDQARRHRKLFGGGMRQAGVLAAAALYALDHHLARLADDHAHAQLLAEGIRATEGLRLEPAVVETNILYFHVPPRWGPAAAFSARLRQHGLLMNSTSPTALRAVTHLDVDAQAVARAIEVIRAVLREGP